MHILILAQYYAPESVGVGIHIRELALDLQARGHRVTVLTAFPNYPGGVIFDGYRGKLYQRESLEGIDVVRTWIYASPSKALWSRLINFGSFCASSLPGGLLARVRPDVIYAVLPPLPLGVTAVTLGAVRGAPVIVHIQDIYPDIAVALGVLRNRRMISFFQLMEKWVYAHSRRVVVISEGFRENLLAKGVAPGKLVVVPNWADPDFIQPGERDNEFRRELQVDGHFTLIYAGSLSHNSNVEPVLHAAGLLRDEPFQFVIVGDGVRRAALEQLAAQHALSNVQFKPFQPLARYPQVLAAADMNLVTLSTQAALASVPSKIFKQMAAGRPVLAITAPGNEVARLVRDAGCGIAVPPDDPGALVAALRWAAAHPQELAEMGRCGRRYLEQHHSRAGCIERIDGILREAVRN